MKLALIALVACWMWDVEGRGMSFFSLLVLVFFAGVVGFAIGRGRD